VITTQPRTPHLYAKMTSTESIISVTVTNTTIRTVSISVCQTSNNCVRARTKITQKTCITAADVKWLNHAQAREITKQQVIMGHEINQK